MLIEKLVFGGQALAHQDGKAVFIWNALPGEEVELELTRKKKDFSEGIARNIIKSVSERITPVEEHYLSCSPWQMMTSVAEQYWKRAIAIETYHRLGQLNLTHLELIDDVTHGYGYRNKMEFSFALNDVGQIQLALFERGKKVRTPIMGCQLAEVVINTTAQLVLQWIWQQGITLRSLKTLIVRSNHAGQAIAALFIKDRLEFNDYPELDATFTGFKIYYSTHKSPASVPTALLYETGNTSLTTTINQRQFSFGIFSFFQVNLPIFNLALAEMQTWLDPTLPILDYYSGVGAIGLALAQPTSIGSLIDNTTEAIEYARHNISVNGLNGFTAQAIPAEHMTELITTNSNIILDPPRSGLHQNVIHRLLKVQPERIIYLSCNLSTQARDIMLLSTVYRVVQLKLYNFFPRTPHTEGLCILQRRV